MSRIAVACLLPVISVPAAFAAVTVTNVTSRGGQPTERQVLRTRDGKIYMAEQGYGAEASSAGAASAGDGRSRAVLDGGVRNVMVFNPDVPEMISVESSGVCRVIDKSGAQAGVPGVPGGDQMQSMNDAMANAKRQMAEAMAKARAQGNMTEEQENALNAFMNPRMQGGAAPGQSREINLVPTGDREEFGRFGEAVAYRADGGKNADRYIYWLVPVDRQKGLGEARQAIGGILKFYQDVMNQMGVGQLGSLMTAISKRDNDYPVAIDDRIEGTRDQIESIELDDGGISYEPECTRRTGMFGQ